MVVYLGRIFPWIVDIFDMAPYHFYKVIEVLIRAEEGLSRDVVKHLNHVRILFTAILEIFIFHSIFKIRFALFVMALYF